MSKRVGIINGGGDCPGLNTVIDAIVKSLENQYEILGFHKGFEGLLTAEYIRLNREITSPNRWIGGTILKSVNHGHFHFRSERHGLSKDSLAIIRTARETFRSLGLEGLIVLGGDGTLSIAHVLMEHDFPIIGVPKSIDNDLNCTDFTFGFQTAVETATQALDKLHTTAASHDRIMILEVMGRHAGWIALHSGIAGGANMILIPEIPFTFESIRDFLLERQAHGRTSSVLVIAEGAHVQDSKEQYKLHDHQRGISSLGGIGDRLEHYLNQFSEFEARSTSLGHIQRGGTPNSFDRILSTQLGAKAAELFIHAQFGMMAAYRNNRTEAVSLDHSVSQLKLVDPQSQIVQQARAIGIGFGTHEIH